MKALYGPIEMDWNQFTTYLKDAASVFTSPVFAGTVGAILAVIWHRPDILMVFFYFISGIAAAGWGTEPLMKWQGIDDGWTCIIALIIGGFAGSLASMGYNFIKSGAAQGVIEDFFRRRK